MHNTSEIVVRGYRSEDYDEIIRSGYVFSPYLLKPSLFFRISTHLFGWEQFTLVAHHRLQKRIAGSITYMKYDDKTWVTGPLFVSPDFRGMGVGSLLVSSANGLLKRKGIRKAFGDVPKGNPVIKLHTELGMKLLAPMLEVSGGVDAGVLKERSYVCRVRQGRPHDKPQLLRLYRENTTSPWIEFFEVDASNFLREYSHGIRIIPEFLKRRKIIVAEIDSKVVGYSLIVFPRLTILGRPEFSEINALASIEYRKEVIGALITESLRELLGHGISVALIYLVSANEQFAHMEEILSKLNLDSLVHYCMAYSL